MRIKRADIRKFGFAEEEYEELMLFKKADAQVQIRLTICLNNALKVENLSLKMLCGLIKSEAFRALEFGFGSRSEPITQ